MVVLDDQLPPTDTPGWVWRGSMMIMEKSGTLCAASPRLLHDRRDAGRGDAGTRGRGDAGTPGRRDAGTPGRGDAGMQVARSIHQSITQLVRTVGRDS
jgi:hypothetical protein